MTTFTINLRALKAVSIAAGTEETRYYLNGVNLEHTAEGLIMVATDGHRAIVLRQDWTETLPDAPFKSVIVPLAFINKIKLHKVIDVADMTIGDNGAISIKYIGDTLGTNAIDATFPDWRRVVPKASAPGAIGHYNAEYIAAFHKAGKLLDKGARSPVILHDGENPALVSFYFGQGQGLEAFGVLMPIRTPEVYVRPAPAWAIYADSKPAAKVDAGAVGLAAVAQALESVA